jgi:hypothetical protein
MKVIQKQKELDKRFKKWSTLMNIL